uniref:Sushi domain-containing protein n=1 Tax=Aquila chrysaetos chrysaetos TaxID=223781 RepID=A0A663F7W3_AQUCH
MTVVLHPWLLPVSLPEALPPWVFWKGFHGSRSLAESSVLHLLPASETAPWNDCGPPPRMTHSRPSSDEQASSFPVGSRVTYTCTEGAIKIPGRSDTVECLPGARWSTLPEPCDRSCAAPTRLRFAALSTVDERINFFPVGTNVSYVCRPGYENTSESSPTSTCLENLTWSEAAELCRSEYLCSARLAEKQVWSSEQLHNFFFSCVFSLRYKLDGRHFIQCQLKGNDVEWSKLPTCKLITCSSPPQISNGKHDGEGVEKFAYNSTVTYSCDSGFLLVGNVSIRCTSTDKTNGVWSGAVPECKGAILTLYTLEKSTSVKLGAKEMERSPPPQSELKRLYLKSHVSQLNLLLYHISMKKPLNEFHTTIFFLFRFPWKWHPTI